MKYFLVFVIIAGLGAVAGAIIIGSMTRDEVVVSDPYEAGLRYDHDQHHRQASGLTLDLTGARFMEGANRVSLFVRDSSGRAVDMDPSAISITLVRPSQSMASVSVKDVARAEGGSLRASFTLPAHGIWDFTLTIQHAGKPLTLTKRINAEKTGAAH